MDKESVYVMVRIEDRCKIEEMRGFMPVHHYPKFMYDQARDNEVGRLISHDHDYIFLIQNQQDVQLIKECREVIGRICSHLNRMTSKSKLLKMPKKEAEETTKWVLEYGTSMLCRIDRWRL